MPFLRTLAEYLGLAQRSEMADGIKPKSRDSALVGVSVDDAMALPAVYRGFQVMETAVEQLSITPERNGEPMTGRVDPLIRRPSLTKDRSEFYAESAVSLMASGNAYWDLGINGRHEKIQELKILNPHHVTPYDDQDGNRVYGYKGRTLQSWQVKHLRLLSLPGRITGLGPIQAHRLGLRGALQVDKYGQAFFDTTGQPSGTLTTDQPITPTDADDAVSLWNKRADPEKNPSRIKVLGKGLQYEPIFLKPEDAQWLESRKYNTTEIARLLGMPASLMLAAVDGRSMTYQNVEQEWLAFTRFTLMGYLRKIELAMSQLLPGGQGIRFNIETLLRTDTLSRYRAHSIALQWMLPEEIRAVEGLPQLSAGDLARLPVRPSQSATEIAP